MKKLLLILLCLPLLYSCENNNKETEENLKIVQITDGEKDDLILKFTIDMKKNMEAVNNKDFDVALDMTYPKLFDYAPREELKRIMESTFDVFKDMQLEMSNIRDLHAIINYNGLQFTRFFYDNESVFTFYNRDDLVNSISGFRETFGESNVKVYYETNSISANIISSMVAVSKEGSSEWTYLEWDERKFNQFSELIPIIVLAELKK